MNKKSLKKNIVDKLVPLLEHNEHSIDITIFGRKISPCARCTGMYLGILIGTIFSLLFWLKIFDIEFIHAFAIAWLFAIPAIIDWSSVKLGLRKGKNNIRVATGFLLGMGIATYFFILPAAPIFKIATFGLYDVAIGAPVYATTNNNAVGCPCCCPLLCCCMGYYMTRGREGRGGC